MISRLGDHCDIVMGQAPPGKDCNFNGIGTPFVKAGEFQDRTPIIREWTTQPLKIGKSSDVFVCVVGATAGKINFGIDCAIGRSVAAVRPKPSLNTEILYFLLRERTDILRKKSQGLAQGVITREMLLSQQFFLPTLSEQQRIAAILDKADKLRTKRKRVLVAGVFVSQDRNKLLDLMRACAKVCQTRRLNFLMEIKRSQFR